MKFIKDSQYLYMRMNTIERIIYMYVNLVFGMRHGLRSATNGFPTYGTISYRKGDRWLARAWYPTPPHTTTRFIPKAVERVAWQSNKRGEGGVISRVDRIPSCFWYIRELRCVFSRLTRKRLKKGDTYHLSTTRCPSWVR